MTPAILQAALNYDALGLCVIPIRPGTKIACVAWEPFQRSRADIGTLRGWFAPGGKSLAIVCGKVSGNLIVRDFDTLLSFEKWEAAHPELAATLPTVVTARGRHVYCRANPDAVRRRSKGGKGTITFADGELRGEGVYVLAPPSVHPDGQRYRWSIPLRREIPEVDLDASGLIAMPVSPADTVGAVNSENACGLLTVSTESTAPTVSTVSTDRTASDVRVLIKNAIESTIPAGPGQRRACLFKLARALKAIPSLANLTPLKLDPMIVRQWHALALPVIRTKPIDKTLLDFASAWCSVKYAAGTGPIDEAVARARSAPIPEIALRFETDPLRLLVGLCRELQRLAGDAPFFLDCRTAGNALGVGHTVAWRMLTGLHNMGIIERVSVGSRQSKQASEFRYLHEL